MCVTVSHFLLTPSSCNCQSASVWICVCVASRWFDDRRSADVTYDKEDRALQRWVTAGSCVNFFSVPPVTNITVADLMLYSTNGLNDFASVTVKHPDSGGSERQGVEALASTTLVVHTASVRPHLLPSK